MRYQRQLRMPISGCAQCLKRSSLNHEAGFEFARVEWSEGVATLYAFPWRAECRRLFQNTVAIVFHQSRQG